MENKLKGHVKISILLLTLLLLFGCGAKHTIKVNSIPPGAKVVLDGKTQSDTPCKIKLKEDDMAHYLFISKSGYKKVRKVFRDSDYPDDISIDLEPQN